MRILAYLFALLFFSHSAPRWRFDAVVLWVLLLFLRFFVMILWFVIGLITFFTLMLFLVTLMQALTIGDVETSYLLMLLLWTSLGAGGFFVLYLALSYLEFLQGSMGLE